MKQGRVQKINNSGKVEYKQKGVDTLLVMDLMRIPLDYENIKEIILIACDSDFVPVIKHLKKYGIKTLLYTYFDKKRNSNFSTSNELTQVVHKYKTITLDFFK